MKSHNELLINCYRKLIRLYPARYRKEYEEEMVETMRLMIDSTNTPAAKIRLTFLALKDYLLSLTHQNALLFEDATQATPEYVIESTKYSISLVLPFFIISSYNWLNHYVLHKTIPYLQIENKTWVIYCIVMPAAAGLLVAFAFIRSLLNNIKQNKVLGSESVVLSLPITLLFAFLIM